MGRKPNTPKSNIATSSSPNNLNWENSIHESLDWKKLTKLPLPAEVMHELQRWSEDEVCIKKKNYIPNMPKNLENTNSPTQQTSGANSKVIDKAKDKLNLRYKGIQATVDQNGNR